MAEGQREGRERRVRAPVRGRSAARRIMLASLLCAVLHPVAARAQAPATLDVDSKAGFARLVVTFEERLPEYELSTSTGVLVVAFKAPLAPDVSRLPQRLPAFVSAARTDPDRRAMRIAFAQHVSVNAMEAGEKLFLDLLPDNWVGAAPGLPAEVVAELARRAEEAEKRQRQKEILEQVRNSKPVELRLASLPTFTRFVFIWDHVPNARIERSSDEVRLLFDRGARIDLSGYDSRLPGYVRGIDSSLGENGLEIVLSVDPQAPVRGFREDSTYVVDVTAPSVPSGQPLQEIRMEPEAGPGSPPPPAAPGPTSGPPAGPTSAGEADRRAGYDDTEAENIAARPVARDQAPAAATREAESSAPQAEARPDAAGAAPAAPAEAAPEIALDADMEGADIAAVRAEARRFGTSIRLALPFEEPTAGAVFERAGALWAAFQSNAVIDTRLLRENLVGVASRIESWRDGDLSVLRIALAAPMTTAVSTEATAWILTIGDAPLEPGRPLDLRRLPGRDGEPQIGVEFAGATGAHPVRDRDAGDMLTIVTGPAPARATVKPYNFVEFSALPSIHGLALKAGVDDLAVTVDGGQVRIGRVSVGLTLSDYAGGYVPRMVGDSDDGRPGFVDGFDDGALDPGAVYRMLSKEQREAALAPEIERTRARLKMARALLATDLGAEALGQLALIAQDDPAALRDPSYHAFRGIGLTMLGRADEAIRAFNTFGLGQSTDIALWRGLAEVRRGNWRAAQIAFQAGIPALDSYAKDRQRMFRTAAARAALEVNDIATATVRLAELADAGASADPELNLLDARLAATLGQTGMALAAFDAVALSPDRLRAAEAQLLAAELRAAELRGAAQDARDTDGIIQSLEQLAMSWRGDEIELKALRLLSNLHVETGDYYRAFEIMKSATVANSDSPTTRALQDDMNLAFQDLFLGGRADALPPVDALTLYYDFRELTPIGAKGDEIIRALANRMVEVDLLDQAAELLRHQVDHRLRGAARAQVAARLAWVYLMNRKPTEALNVLARTRQAVLPQAILHQRVLLEARAMAETGRIELALDLLSSIEGPDVDGARADVLWKGEQWQAAAEAIERMLGDTWSGAEPLTPQARTGVLRAAIGYALADDRLGLQRFRAKFRGKMAGGSDAYAFEIVTEPLEANATEFQELVRKVAAVDTLTAFLEEYRARHEPAEPAPSQAPQS